MRRRPTVVAAALALTTTAACARPPHTGLLAPAGPWSAAAAAARADVAAGEYAAADSVLRAFADHYPGTPAATESLYWRALYALDPANAAATPTTAQSLLDAYIVAPHHEPHAADAGVLRRTADALAAVRQQAEQAASEADSVRTQADSAKRAARAGVTRGRTRDEEIARLRDELDKALTELDQANQELDRIKKRLTAPKP